VVQVELVVEPLSGNCDTAAFFCEPFDELGLGGLAGQRGWQASPQPPPATSWSPTRGRSRRQRPGARPVGSQSGLEQVDFTPRQLDELEVSFE
jgi:hypothetical protein